MRRSERQWRIHSSCYHARIHGRLQEVDQSLHTPPQLRAGSHCNSGQRLSHQCHIILTEICCNRCDKCDKCDKRRRGRSHHGLTVPTRFPLLLTQLASHAWTLCRGRSLLDDPCLIIHQIQICKEQDGTLLLDVFLELAILAGHRYQTRSCRCNPTVMDRQGHLLPIRSVVVVIMHTFLPRPTSTTNSTHTMSECKICRQSPVCEPSSLCPSCTVVL